ncbi:MAG: hypothetical protein JNN20_06690 [Betaproteobacteria bacterium]|nr:hypothetical protein [Betaproteobacteria bacterium]
MEEFSMESDINRFLRLRKRDAPQWWLDLRVCPGCEQHWLVAQEERFNDIWIMRRLSQEDASAIETQNRWPLDFDHYETLIRIGAEQGHAARFWDSREAIHIVIDLVGQRASISAAEVASLVNVSHSSADALLSQAREAIALRGYPYPWAAIEVRPY